MSKKPEAAVEEWNARYPIGTPVTRYKLIAPLRDGNSTKTRSAAWVMGGHSAMVMVEGVAGGVLLESVVPEVVEDSPSEAWMARKGGVPVVVNIRVMVSGLSHIANLDEVVPVVDDDSQSGAACVPPPAGPVERRTPEMDVEEWNRLYPPGTPVTRYALVDNLRSGVGVKTKTRGVAWIMPAARVAMIFVEDVAGCVILDSVVPDVVASPVAVDSAPTPVPDPVPASCADGDDSVSAERKALADAIQWFSSVKSVVPSIVESFMRKRDDVYRDPVFVLGDIPFGFNLEMVHNKFFTQRGGLTAPVDDLNDWLREACGELVRDLPAGARITPPSIIWSSSPSHSAVTVYAHMLVPAVVHPVPEVPFGVPEHLMCEKHLAEYGLQGFMRRPDVQMAYRFGWHDAKKEEPFFPSACDGVSLGTSEGGHRVPAD